MESKEHRSVKIALLRMIYQQDWIIHVDEAEELGEETYGIFLDLVEGGVLEPRYGYGDDGDGIAYIEYYMVVWQARKMILETLIEEDDQ